MPIVTIVARDRKVFDQINGPRRGTLGRTISKVLARQLGVSVKEVGIVWFVPDDQYNLDEVELWISYAHSPERVRKATRVLRDVLCRSPHLTEGWNLGVWHPQVKKSYQKGAVIHKKN